MGLCLRAVQRLAHGLDAQDGFVIAAAGVVFYDAGDQDHLLVLEVEHDQVVDEKELHGVRVAGSQLERWFGVLNEIVREIAGEPAAKIRIERGRLVVQKQPLERVFWIGNNCRCRLGARGVLDREDVSFERDAFLEPDADVGEGVGLVAFERKTGRAECVEFLKNLLRGVFHWQNFRQGQPPGAGAGKQIVNLFACLHTFLL